MSPAGRAPTGHRTAALAWAAAALATLALVPVGLLRGPVDSSAAATGSGPGSSLDEAVVGAAVVLATMSAALMGALLASRVTRSAGCCWPPAWC
jgi:hypothetical protein